MMMPPVAPAILASNPKFAKVHEHLTKHLLNDDASTATSDASRQATLDKLTSQRVQVAEHHLLTNALFRICVAEGVPDDLRDLVLVVAGYICDSGGLSVSEEEHELMREDVQAFKVRIGDVARELGRDLREEYETLNSIANAAPDGLQMHDTKRSRITARDSSASLESITDDLKSTIANLRSHVIPAAQYSSTTALTSLLQSQSQHLQHLIRNLEQRTHGAEARHVIARAQFLSTVAQGLEAKTKVTYLERRRDVYSLEMREGLKKRMRELDEEERGVEERKMMLEGTLEEYEDVGGEVMRALGRRYAEIEREVEEVRGDIEGLRGKVRRGDG